MEVTRKNTDTFQIGSGDHVLTLSRDLYEDVYYSIPIDPSNLYILLNETLLKTQEERKTLQNIIDREGGIQKCMESLIEHVKQTRPEAKTEKEPKSDEVVEDGVEIVEDSSTSNQEEEDKSTPDLILEGEDISQDIEAEEVESEEIDLDMESGSGVKSVEGSDIKIIRYEEGNSDLTLSKFGEDYFDIRYGNTGIRIPHEKIQELYLSLPDNNPKLFKVILKNILDSQESRTVFRKILSRAGGLTSSLQEIRDDLEQYGPELLP